MFPMMSFKIQRKTFYLIAATSFFLVGLTSLISWIIIMGGFARLEETFMERNISRSREILFNRIENISTKLVDWSTWDDTYKFIEDRNEAYIESNLVNNALEMIKIDMMFFVNTQGEIVYFLGNIQEKIERQIPDELRPYFSAGSPLLAVSEKTRSVSGIMMLPAGPAMVAARPIVTSDGSDPVRGAMVFVAYLNDKELRKMGVVTKSDLEIQLFNAVSMPSDYRAALDAFKNGKNSFIGELSRLEIAGYSVIADLDGRNGLILKVIMPREISLFGRLTFAYFVVGLILVGFVFGICVYLFLVKEVSAREEAEKKLKRFNDMFLDLAKHSRTVVWEVDAQGLYTYVSSAAYNVWGYRPQEMVGRMHFYDLHPEEGREAFKKAAFSVFESKETFNDMVNPVQMKDGKKIFVSTTGMPVLNADGSLRGYRGKDIDITKRKLVEEVLITHKSHLDLALHSAQMGVLRYSIIDSKYTLDEQGCALFGVDPDKFAGTTEEFFACVHPDDHATMTSALNQAIELGRLYQVEYRVIWPDGSLREITARGQLVREHDGTPKQIHGVIWDITLQKKMQKDIANMNLQLVQADRLSTLGEMATGLAHEINQPLGAISLIATSFRKLMEKNKLSEDKLRDGLKDMETSIARMAKTVEHIRIYARQEVLDFYPIEIPETVDSAMGLLGEQLRINGIEVTIASDPGLPKIVGEPHQLEQVWINFITNARDAMQEKEKLINAGKIPGTDYQKKLAITQVLSSDARMICISFSDNGMGISEENKKKIFDPFFTTKEVGKGTGLGLAISFGIIDKHNGKIELDSKRGDGATFKVYLPVDKV